MRFYAQTKLSEHISETPEGFLICHGVAIARPGDMTYLPEECALEPGEDGLVHVSRTEEVVFDPAAMASFEGKAVTIGHPEEDVTPANWKELAEGHAQDVRRGEGEEADLLLADLVITGERAIALVRGGLREVSCGYDTPYEQTAPGRGRQVEIRGNHIALVQRGRCGARCRINDQSEDTMKFGDKLLKALGNPKVRKAMDEAAEEAKPDTQPEKPAQDEGEDRIAALEEKFGELVLTVRQLHEQMAKLGKPEPEEAATDEDQPAEPDVPDGGKKPEEKANDKARDAATRAAVMTVDADVKSRSALLAPSLPVRDTDARCNVQRVALRTAMTNDAALNKVVAAALGGSTLDSCDCMTLDAAFTLASDVAAAKNNATTVDGLTRATTTKDFGKPASPADINAMNAKFYGGKEK
jgi:hypothetical protein